MSSALIGVAFWTFVAVVVVAAIWYAYARNRETQKTVRLAIEKNMELDAALIESLVSRKSGRPEDYYLAAIICISVGIGLPIFGYFLSRIQAGVGLQGTAGFQIAGEILVGAGILVGLIGIGLAACGMLLRRRDKADREGKYGT